jgi:hypothetical protein
VTVALIAALVVIAALVGVVVWSVRRGDARVDELHVANERAMTQTLAAERAQFEIEKRDIALASAAKRAAALKEYVSHYAEETDENADLAPDDVDGRVLRLAQRWEEADVPAAGGALRPAASGAVRRPEGAGATDPDVREAARRDDTDLMRPED